MFIVIERENQSLFRSAVNSVSTDIQFTIGEMISKELSFPDVLVCPHDVEELLVSVNKKTVNA